MPPTSSSSAAPAATMAFSDPGPLVPDRRKRLIVFCFLMLTLFMATLDNQIVSTALPTIVGEFGAIERFGWVGSAYLLATSAMMPIYGKLGDLFGRKYVMLGAVSLFLIGSFACGFAWSMNSLIAARVLQGLGGGGIMVSIFSVNADLFEPRERAKYQSFSSLMLMASGSIGPTLGGFLSDAFGWRSIFLVNLPIGVIALAGIAIMLPYRRPNRVPKIDYWGALTLALAISSLVLWADSGQIFGGLFTAPALAVIGVGVLSAVIWVQIERRAPEPIVPLHLFRKPVIPLLLIVAITSGATGIGLVNYIALYLQTTTGLSPSRAGLFFIALTGGIVIGSMSAGRLIARSGQFKRYLVAGQCICILMLVGISQTHAGTPLLLIGAMLLLQGFGIGLGQQSPVIGVQNAAPKHDVGAATGAVTLTRMGGAAIAISIYGAILSQGLAAKLTSIPGVANIAELTPKMLAALPLDSQHQIGALYADAFTPLYLTGAALLVIGLVAALLMKPAPLPMARQQEAAPVSLAQKAA
jgi:EmrB/QacA subfamily drug resistance transporter